MRQVSRHAIVACSCEQMYRLVSDVGAYNEFLPWCKGASVEVIDDDKVRARLEISRSGIDLSFTTVNRSVANRSIEMQLAEGPFKTLHGLWTFAALGEKGCKVSLALRFEVSGSLHAFATERMFAKVSSTLVDSFVRRARHVYR